MKQHFSLATFIHNRGTTKAGEWFASAAEIDPDRETAYRYWGDVTYETGSMTEAGDKFIEAYIAEPYSRLTQAEFLNWGQTRQRQPCSSAKSNFRRASHRRRKEAATITLDPNLFKKDDKSGPAAAWLRYGMIRGELGQGRICEGVSEGEDLSPQLERRSSAFRAAASRY